MLIVLALAANVFAGSSLAAENSLTVNPLGLLFGTISGQYERALGADKSFMLEGAVFGISGGSAAVGAIGGNLGLRWYTSGEALRGFYFGGKVGLGTAGMTDGYDTVTSTALTFGGEIGYKWLFENGFTVDLGGGMGIAATSVSDSMGYSASGAGVIPELHLNLGFSW